MSFNLKHIKALSVIVIVANLSFACQRVSNKKIDSFAFALAEDLFHRVKFAVASAVDARMNGQALPAMTSGGSGNQGIIASLAPCLVGRELHVDEERIDRCGGCADQPQGLGSRGRRARRVPARLPGQQVRG